MGSGELPTELTYLAWSLVLLLVQLILQGALSNREVGLRYNAGPRDEGRKARGVYAGRAERTLRNFVETYPAFVGLAVALAAADRSGGLGGLGAALWFWGRVAYVPLYMFGVPFLRTAAFGVSVAGLALMMVRLLG